MKIFDDNDEASDEDGQNYWIEKKNWNEYGSFTLLRSEQIGSSFNTFYMGITNNEFVRGERMDSTFSLFEVLEEEKKRKLKVWEWWNKCEYFADHTKFDILN